MIPVMILCAGMGSRLQPLSAWRAKPMVPIGDRPALAHVIARVSRVASRIVVNAHHRAEDIQSFAEAAGAHAPEGGPPAPSIAVSVERALLGTAGGVAHAHALLGDGPVLVWNGDIWADIDAAALVATHREAARVAGQLATLAVRAVAAGEGNVGIDASGAVVRMRRETVRAGEVRAFEFLGVHVIAEELRARMPERGCLVGDVYLPLLRAGGRLGIAPHTGTFVDVGTVASYVAANDAWRAAVGVDTWVAATAQVDQGVVLRGCIVGDGARVTGRGALDRVIVWPGAEVSAPLDNAVVARQGRAPSG